MLTASARLAVAPDWRRDVLEALQREVFEHPDREVGGVLVGELVDGRLPLVNALIPVLRARAHERVAFDHAAWSRVHEAMARHYPTQLVLGWYVSRPAHGVFLSETDLATHQHYFSRPDQVVLIIDGATHEGGLFGWHGAAIRLIDSGPIPTIGPARPALPWRGATALVAASLVTGGLAHLVAG